MFSIKVVDQQMVLTVAPASVFELETILIEIIGGWDVDLASKISCPPLLFDIFAFCIWRRLLIIDRLTLPTTNSELMQLLRSDKWLLSHKKFLWSINISGYYWSCRYSDTSQNKITHSKAANCVRNRLDDRLIRTSCFFNRFVVLTLWCTSDVRVIASKLLNIK